MINWFGAMSEAVADAASSASITALPLFTKGLLTTLIGLLGVFLVLTLFFVTIKLMQRIGAGKGEK